MKLFIGAEVNDGDKGLYYLGNIVKTEEKIMDLYYNFRNYSKTLFVEFVKPICTHDKQEFDTLLKEIKYSLMLRNDGIRFSNSENRMSVKISDMIEMSVVHGDMDINKEIMKIIDSKVPSMDELKKKK